MAQDFITIKIWKSTRKAAKELALEYDVSLAALLDKLVKEAKKDDNLSQVFNSNRAS